MVTPILLRALEVALGYRFGFLEETSEFSESMFKGTSIEDLKTRIAEMIDRINVILFISKQKFVQAVAAFSENTREMNRTYVEAVLKAFLKREGQGLRTVNEKVSESSPAPMTGAISRVPRKKAARRQRQA
jgi:hypothetical protein